MNTDYCITKIGLHELLPNVLNSVNSVYIIAKLRRMFICICFFRNRSILQLYFDVSSSPLIEGRKMVSDSGGARFKMKDLVFVYK